jgi:hypothetical protein
LAEALSGSLLRNHLVGDLFSQPKDRWSTSRRSVIAAVYTRFLRWAANPS